MAKHIKITVVMDENPDVEQKLEMKVETVPSVQEWEQILEFMDEHVGGRPDDRK